MRRFRSPISLLLCIAVFASLFSGFAASAAPLKPHTTICEDKPANLTVESLRQQPQVPDCCLPEKTKLASTSFDTKASISPSSIDCCEVTLLKLPTRGKLQIGASVTLVDPCGPVDTSCGITYPVGSVVGNMPFNQQGYYAPGLIASGVTINAGTYWVTGLGKAANGDGFYQIVVACQYLFVPQIDVVPSYQSPWSGQPLPTTPPVEN